MSKETKQFCRECNNMLYPKEDKQEKMLYLACKNCEHFEEAVGPVVYSVNYKKTNNKNIISSTNKELVNDPTLRRVSKECTRCKKETSHILYRPKDIEENLALIMNYVCTKCYKLHNSLEKKIRI
ncbi:DNA-directed RNA polymerase II subunit RPB9 [Nematocida sp. AWRm80]|nr:DNA-directed RNA polymerase II subunit RPB9 [Nematocida sp. AWRm80]